MEEEKKDKNKDDFPKKRLKKKKTKKKRLAEKNKPLQQESTPDEQDEVSTLIGKMRKMVDDLNEKMGGVIKLSGVPEEQARQLLENPSEFNQKALKKVEERNEDLMQKVEGVLGKSARKSKEGSKKGKKKKKGSFLAARKNWIPMR